MKLNIGGTSKHLEMKTPANFLNAMHNPLLKPRIVEIVDARDHAELLKVLNRGGPHPLDRFASQLRWNPGS